LVPVNAVLLPLDASVAYWTAAPASCWPVAIFAGMPVAISAEACVNKPLT
jgi:hypothetical protein